MLNTSSRYSEKAFLSKKRLFLDSCIINKWANERDLDQLFEKVAKKYSVLISTVSILEVGFGPSDKASNEQKNRASKIYEMAANHPIDNEKIHLLDVLEKSLPGTSVYNPNHHEWYASRHILVRLMDAPKNKKGENARKLANDALIYHCCWNSRAAIITNDLKHFVLLNSFQHPQKTQDGHLRHVPIFTLDDLNDSINQDISYPDNLPSNLKDPHGW